MYGLEAILNPNKETIQGVIEKLTDGEKKDLDDFLKRIDHSSNEPAWQRYAGAFIGFPKTWWIGIFQLQMIAGLWEASTELLP